MATFNRVQWPHLLPMKGKLNLQTIRLTRAAGVATAALTTLCLYAAHGSLAAKPAKTMKPAAGSVSQGKVLISQNRCNGCHGPDLKGRPGFSPNIRKTGALHDYTQAQFVTLLHTGMKNDGGHVRRPMPVYPKMTTGQATSIFAYLETQK